MKERDRRRGPADVSVGFRIKAEALEVIERSGIETHAWAEPGEKTRRSSSRKGLPRRTKPGRKYGPFELRTRLGLRLRR
jgi:hypothetical protein